LRLRRRGFLPVAGASSLGGWVGLNAAGSEAEVVAAGPISASPRLVMRCRVSLVSRCGSVADAPGWVNVGVVPEPRVELEAVRSSFPLRCGLSGWRIDGSVMRRITVTGPVAGDAVWTLDHLPTAALAGSAAVDCYGGGGPKGVVSGRWSPRRLATGGLRLTCVGGVEARRCIGTRAEITAAPR